MQIGHMLNYNISVFRPYKIQQCSTEHLQRQIEMQCNFYIIFISSKKMCKWRTYARILELIWRYQVRPNETEVFVEIRVKYSFNSHFLRNF